MAYDVDSLLIEAQAATDKEAANLPGWVRDALILFGYLRCFISTACAADNDERYAVKISLWRSNTLDTTKGGVVVPTSSGGRLVVRESSPTFHGNAKGSRILELNY